MKRFFPSIVCLTLLGCSNPAELEVSRNTNTLDFAVGMQSFPNTTAKRSVLRSNIDITQEFLDLTFALESGQEIPRLTRFKGPITIAINAVASNYVVKDLDRLIQRLRKEAGLDIHRIKDGPANIYVELLPKKQLQKTIPTAACFVVPNVAGWVDYRRNRFNKIVDWTRLEVRSRITVFMPDDVSPQESRDCLHEEIAQALGPVNDLYRLPDSVYNDDNFNISLTAYDMLILQAYYAPEIRNGMSKAQVASLLPRLLARLNPAGQQIEPAGLQKTAKNWSRAIEATLGPNIGRARRRDNANRAVRIAQNKGYNDHRLGFSYFARAQVSLRDDPNLASSDFTQAYTIFKTLFGTADIHTAQAAVQMASLAISVGKFDAALQFINESIPAARESQDGRLLFSLLAMKAEVYEGLGRYSDAKTLKKQAISWGYYGLGSRNDVTKRLEQVASLRPRVSTKGF